ncbi:hypothetical protein [Nocardia brevicatena]|uniref:hypothetical protein n=1 Tax=Nocardia brevicatena TaxID=37327 RepID=UPI0002E33743|nr:hypothetical protein [Nocardia brevicatena]
MADRRAGDNIDNRIFGAVESVTGIQLAIPIVRENSVRCPWDSRKFAVDLAPEVVEVRVVAAALPLPPLLDRAAAAIRAVLAGTAWEGAELRLVVTELDAAAVSGREAIR